MNARDRNAALQKLDGGLEFWHERWILQGPHLICSACQAPQAARQAVQSFVHAEGCPQAGDFAQHPWRELAELLQHLPAVP